MLQVLCQIPVASATSAAQLTALRCPELLPSRSLGYISRNSRAHMACPGGRSQAVILQLERSQADRLLL